LQPEHAGEVTGQETSIQLYLVLETGAGCRDRLAAALEAGGVASVLIAAPDGAPPAEADTRPLIEPAQSRGVAVLVMSDAGLARRTNADGVHLPNTKNLAADYQAARAILGPSAIVGVHAGKSRHDAMTLAEAGANYIAFGAPQTSSNRDAARARRLDLVAWWAEIFEVPCVALDVEGPDEAAELALAGADFIGITIGRSQSPHRLRERLASIGEAVSRRMTV
jgi:thiamine-phosphate pyrophosphorylase